MDLDRLQTDTKEIYVHVIGSEILARCLLRELCTKRVKWTRNVWYLYRNA